MQRHLHFWITQIREVMYTQAIHRCSKRRRMQS
nr:MAG TPA: hypothetical protein [Caudoviricetes sp.]